MLTYSCTNASVIYNYRITIVMNVETDIIVSIATSSTGGAVQVLILHVDTFSMGFIGFIGKVIMCLTSYSPIIFSIGVSPFMLTISCSEI